MVLPILSGIIPKNLANAESFNSYKKCYHIVRIVILSELPNKDLVKKVLFTLSSTFSKMEILLLFMHFYRKKSLPVGNPV